MINLIKSELESYGIFTSNIPEVLTELAKSIPNSAIPERMKLTLAVSELMLFTSQFRRNIAHWNGSQIPINSITFTLAKSGAGKDSSVSALRKCFQISYDKFNEKRKIYAKIAAIKAAAEAGENNPNQQSVYRNYYAEPNPLFASPSTVEGFIQHLNELDVAGLGAGFIYSGEFGSELITSPVIQSNLQLLAETYDEGNKEVKIIKNKETQSKAIKNLPVSALFVGSQDNILFDEQIKNKFKLEFSTKLARRSFFNFNPEQMDQQDFKSIADMLAYELKIENDAMLVRQQLSAVLSILTDYQLTKLKEPIQISEDVMNIFLLYKRYNSELSEKISGLYPISKLVRMHLQWKALKLAGAIAFFNQNEEITISDYVQAINFTEMLDNDMQLFEAELVKEPYELFVSYMNNLANNNKATISLHQLRKMGYIPLTGKPEQRMKELVRLAASYDKDGIYTIEDTSINFERIIKTEGNGVSYLAVSGDKDYRAQHCAYGYEYTEIKFEQLGQLLTGDYAYSPFEFKDGIRGKDNIIGGCKWICLDVDKSTLTDEEVHFLLQNYNHYIVRTSNKDNPYKFRILLELDSYVDVPDKAWKSFIRSICEYIAIDADQLPKAQIFFSYADRNVLSTVDKQPIEVKDHLMVAYNHNEQRTDVIKLTPVQRKEQLANIRDTFWYLYEAEDGQGSISMIRAIKHMKDLGASKEQTYALINDANEYWIYPLPEQRLERTIYTQIDKHFPEE